MRGPRQESCRIGTSQGTGTGFFLLPRLTPPFPLAFLLPNPHALTPHGDSEASPRLRPEWELSWALARSGIASFACAFPLRATPKMLIETWRFATEHRLLSRSRLGVVAMGASTPQIPGFLSEFGALDLRPRTVVLAAPMPEQHSATAVEVDDIPIHVMRGNPAVASQTEASWWQSGERSEQLIEDLSPCLRRLSDLEAHRSIVHPTLIKSIGEHLKLALLPSWEQAVRAPGVAIGQAPTEQ